MLEVAVKTVWILSFHCWKKSPEIDFVDSDRSQPESASFDFQSYLISVYQIARSVHFLHNVR